MYGAGLRVVEAARLRVKDIDFDKQAIVVRDGKGGKDGTTLLPTSLTARLTERIALIRARRQAREAFYPVPVTVPHALKRKYPSASGSLQWQWLFPSAGVCMDADGDPARHQVHVSFIQRAIKQAVQACGLGKPASSHTFRIPLLPSCCAGAVISARYRRCSGMPTCARRKSIRMCWVRHLRGCAARWVERWSDPWLGVWVLMTAVPARMATCHHPGRVVRADAVAQVHGRDFWIETTKAPEGAFV